MSSVVAGSPPRTLRPVAIRRRRHAAVDAISNTWAADLGLAVLMFFFLFNVSFRVAPSATTGRLVLLFVLPFCARKTWKVLVDLLRMHGVATVVFVLIVVYAAMLYLLSGAKDTTQLSRLFHLVLYSIVGSAMFAALVRRNLERFLWIYSLATLIQAFFIFVSFLSRPYRWILARTVVQSGLISLMSEVQAPGFSNSSGAWLSLIQGMGVFTALYGVRLAHSGRRTFFLYFAAICIGASTLVTGRTGVLFVAATVVFFAVASRPKQAIRLLAVAALLLLVLWPTRGWITRSLSELNPRFGSAVERGVEVFFQRAETDSYRALVDQPIPPLTAETFIGTGVVSATEGLNASGSDSGYIQTYYSLGLAVSLVFYGTVALVLATMLLRAPDRAAFAFAALFLFMVEVKEPFIFKYDYLFALFGMALCFPKAGPRPLPMKAGASAVPIR
jgi:hypothetical protein